MGPSPFMTAAGPAADGPRRGGRPAVAGAPGERKLDFARFCQLHATRAKATRPPAGKWFGRTMSSLIKRLAVVVPLLMGVGNAFGENRYDIDGMTCEQVQALLQSEGAATLRYQSKRVIGLPVYDRYVRNRQYCDMDQITSRTGIPTADKKYCAVFKCVESSIFVAR